ncbi:hypothetical protein BESB_019310 [Besnoitia besnoiti]|uniref:Transmembrane protein n=1 Tax=Besnoitia besnoiti TaxID=94643 RepID=A0A2A9M9D4_BESBE|nr:hypothetical protein BESB_019310 [Besnoitia besnoiti]PFH31990.1 hypothetical protein BESB_019310 [Besnoitia besnoiti]
MRTVPSSGPGWGAGAGDLTGGRGTAGTFAGGAERRRDDGEPSYPHWSQAGGPLGPDAQGYGSHNGPSAYGAAPPLMNLWGVPGADGRDDRRREGDFGGNYTNEPKYHYLHQQASRPFGGPAGQGAGPLGSPGAGGDRFGGRERDRDFEMYEGRGRDGVAFGLDQGRRDDDALRNDGERGPAGGESPGVGDRETRREAQKRRKSGRDKGRRKKGSVAWVVSIYTVALLVLFLGCAISGVFVGIIVTSPTVRVANTALRVDGQETVPESDAYGPSIWHFRVGAKGELEMGGDIAFVLPLVNPSIFTLQFVVQKLSVFYYPIGKTFQCLLYHGGVIGSDDQPLFRHRELFAEPSNGNATRYIGALDMVVKPTEGAVNADRTFLIQTQFGLTVPQAYLPQVKPLFDDCVEHKMMIYSVEVSEAHTESPLTLVKMPGPIEVLTTVNCMVGPGVDALFKGLDRAYQPVILENLPNTPMTFP